MFNEEKRSYTEYSPEMATERLAGQTDFLFFIKITEISSIHDLKLSQKVLLYQSR